MSTHQLIATVARNLKVSESDLLDLERRNWISSVTKNGNVFLSGRDAFRAKFIFHLRRLDLTDAEIGRVLEIQVAGSYSLAELPQLLGRSIPLLISRRN
jgi:DNA-binding transcriptional MerR regulator